MNPNPLTEARLNRHRKLTENVSAVIGQLVSEGKRVSFYAVAKHAGIARSTLYRCDDLRQLVTSARAAQERETKSTAQAYDFGPAAKTLDALRIERDALLQALNELHANPKELARPCHYGIVRF